jgi:tRNA1Val (adenine37-N6)-methyltransferase
MKVGTDGVLIGTWADTKNARTILDAGSGSGLITLIAAQRSQAEIDAVEIDHDAFMQSVDNVNASPWKDRISVIHVSFTDYCANTDKKYDLIISNPPYFKASLLPPDGKRQSARHDINLPLSDLISGCQHLLNNHGKAALILPITAEKELLELLDQNELYPQRLTRVKPTPTSDSKRLLIEFGKDKTDFTENELIIETSRHQYSEEFKALTQDFYL